jgi:hypothetical protein
MKTVYVCDYCGDSLTDSDECRNHEFNCDHNPAMRACVTCQCHGTDVAGTGKVWNTCDKNLLTSNLWIENYAINCPGWIWIRSN